MKPNSTAIGTTATGAKETPNGNNRKESREASD